MWRVTWLPAVLITTVSSNSTDSLTKSEQGIVGGTRLSQLSHSLCCLTWSNHDARCHWSILALFLMALLQLHVTVNPMYLFKMLVCKWISMGSFTKRSIHSVILEKTVMSLKLIWCCASTLRSATANLSSQYRHTQRGCAAHTSVPSR
jgi:hypothetical protein